MPEEKQFTADEVGFIFSIINFTDDVTKEGAPAPRSSWKKEHWSGATSLLKKCTDTVRVKIGDEYKKIEDLTPEEKKTIKDTSPSFMASDLNPTDAEKKAFKHYYDTRDELPRANVDLSILENKLKV